MARIPGKVPHLKTLSPQTLQSVTVMAERAGCSRAGARGLQSLGRCPSGLRRRQLAHRRDRSPQPLLRHTSRRRPPPCSRRGWPVQTARHSPAGSPRTAQPVRPAHPWSFPVALPGLRPADAESLLSSCKVTGDSQAIQDYLKSECDCHPLVTSIVACLINDYLPAKGNFDAWAADPDGGPQQAVGDFEEASAAYGIAP